MINIQYRDNTGNWRTINVIFDKNEIKFSMENAKGMFPDSEIRAVDENGSIVDFL